MIGGSGGGSRIGRAGKHAPSNGAHQRYAKASGDARHAGAEGGDGARELEGRGILR